MPRLRPRTLLAGGALLALTVFGARDLRRLVLSAWSEYAQFRPRHATVPLPADAAALGFRPVALAVPGVGTVRGWEAPSRNGAAVVLVHGSGGDRREVLDVAEALVAGGYGALLFDWPGHGESDGVVRFGAPERRALQVAVGRLGTRPDVRDGRVGAYGFSMGAFLLAQTAAADRRVRAVVLAAAPEDAMRLTHSEYGPKGRLAEWGALLGDRLGGMRLDEPQPIAVVRRIAPRPVLIVTGTADRQVPPEAAQDLYAAAGEPKRLWLVEGAGHGGYERAARGYGVRVRGFFDGALTPPPARPAPGH